MYHSPLFALMAAMTEKTMFTTQITPSSTNPISTIVRIELTM